MCDGISHALAFSHHSVVLDLEHNFSKSPDCKEFNKCSDNTYPRWINLLLINTRSFVGFGWKGIRNTLTGLIILKDEPLS